MSLAKLSGTTAVQQTNNRMQVIIFIQFYSFCIVFIHKLLENAVLM